MNIISTIFGVVGLVLLVLIIFPILGAISSWVALVISILGLLFGVFSRKKSGRNLNLIVIIISLIRLYIGGGLL